MTVLLPSILIQDSKFILQRTLIVRTNRSPRIFILVEIPLLHTKMSIDECAMLQVAVVLYKKKWIEYPIPLNKCAKRFVWWNLGLSNIVINIKRIRSQRANTKQHNVPFFESCNFTQDRPLNLWSEKAFTWYVSKPSFVRQWTNFSNTKFDVFDTIAHTKNTTDP